MLKPPYLGISVPRLLVSVRNSSPISRRKLTKHVSASIRAYGAQDAFKTESYKRINRYTRASRAFWSLNRYGAARYSPI